MKMHDNGNVNEIIMPEELTSLLFLQNPNKFYNRVSEIGLNELIAQTLSDEYPSRDLINDFYETVSNSESISIDDYKILLSAISQESTKKIRHLIDDSTTDPNKFHSEISEILAKSRRDKEDDKKKREIEKAEREALVGKNVELNSTLQNLSKRITDLETSEKKKNDIIKSQKRWKIITLLIIINLLFIILLLLFPSMYKWIKTVIHWIMSVSGLWAFGNFLLNVSEKVRVLFDKFINII